jgi:hypothetical protein
MGTRVTGDEAAEQLAERLSTMGDLAYRRARPEDYSSVIRLQTANYIDNLTEAERKEGFLSAKLL